MLVVLLALEGRRHTTRVQSAECTGDLGLWLPTTEQVRSRPRFFLARTRTNAGQRRNRYLHRLHIMRMCWWFGCTTLSPKRVWSKRYELINDFEKNTPPKRHPHSQVLSSYQPKESSSSDSSSGLRIRRATGRSASPTTLTSIVTGLSRNVRGGHGRASTKHAPWYFPSDYKWLRYLAVSEIVADALDDLNLKVRPTQLDIWEIRRKYSRSNGPVGTEAEETAAVSLDSEPVF